MISKTTKRRREERERKGGRARLGGGLGGREGGRERERGLGKSPVKPCMKKREKGNSAGTGKREIKLQDLKLERS